MSISKKNQEMLASMSPNLIYAFIPESEVTKEVFGKYVDIIQAKRDAQRTFIQATARANLYTNSEKFYDFVREQLEDVYDKSVQDIIYYLAKNGSLPASKYEEQKIAGIHCIGEVNDAAFDLILSNFGKQYTSSFNAQSGSVQGGKVSTNYDSFGNIWKNTYMANDGLTITSIKTGDAYSLYSASNGINTIDLKTGKAINANQNNFWNNLNNALPAIQGLLSTVLSILQQTLNPLQMSPSQVGDGWVYPGSTTSSSLKTGLITAGIIGGAVLLTDKKKK